MTKIVLIFACYHRPTCWLHKSSKLTCTHTDMNDSPDWWTVSFTQPVDINKVLVYNRNDTCCNQRLIGFTMTAQPEPGSTSTPYTYTDSEDQAQAFYTLVPSPKVSFPVREVRFDAGPTSTLLTLCEVYVFGEISCPAGTFGLACERQCNCASDGVCFVHSGGCPDGCATNYDGEDCYDCAPGKYGATCNQNCSVNCGGDNSCDRTYGTCSHECDPGYFGDQCQSLCSIGRYGTGCSQNCSSNCAGSDTCNNVNGSCSNGCEDGYKGDKCNTPCEAGTYGAGCTGTCSVHCAGQRDPCNHVTGYCDQGCDWGYQQRKCTQECDAGWYGAGCLSRCSTNCAGSDNACNHVTGFCDNCPPAMYGSDCSGVCSVHCAGPNNACDRNTGECDDGCDPGHWGQKCLKDCSETCAGPDNACDRLSGVCVSCDPGFYGDKCQFFCSSNCGGADKTCEQFGGRCSFCLPGYYGNTCTGECSSSCAGTTCDRDTGACLSCPPGRYETNCLSLCNDNCGGSSNICNILSGYCEEGCDPGYTGAKCDQACKAGTYGAGCTGTCSVHCAGQGDPCNHVTGYCDQGCGLGYQERKCTQVCPRGQYGPGCVHNCSDQCVGQDRPCHHVDGMCYFGCLQDDQSPMCRGYSAFQHREESEESDHNKIWPIAATVVAAVSIVLNFVGVLMWRCYKASHEQSRFSSPANINISSIKDAVPIRPLPKAPVPDNLSEYVGPMEIRQSEDPNDVYSHANETEPDNYYMTMKPVNETAERSKASHEQSLVSSPANINISSIKDGAEISSLPKAPVPDSLPDDYVGPMGIRQSEDPNDLYSHANETEPGKYFKTMQPVNETAEYANQNPDSPFASNEYIIMS